MSEDQTESHRSKLSVRETVSTTSPEAEKRLESLLDTTGDEAFEHVFSANIQAGLVELQAGLITPQELATRATQSAQEARGKDTRAEGVLNKYGFVKKLKEVFEYVKRGQLWAIAVVDGNDFKYINDAFGHSVGDAVIKENLCALRKGLRPTDIIASIGGDEIAILIPITLEEKDGLRTTPDEALSGFGTKAQEILSGSVKNIPGFTGQYTTSLGISFLDFEDETYLAGLLRADSAQYVSKGYSKEAPTRTNQLTLAYRSLEPNRIVHRNIETKIS